jgi:methyl coenzyme M reductase subunit D
VSLAVLTGCGGSGGGDSAASDVSPSASAAEASAAVDAVKPLTSGELESAALVKADLTGYEVSTPAKAEITAADGVKVSGQECVPLGRAVAGTAVGEPAATAHRRVSGVASGEAALDINTGTVTLASYASADEAAAALKSVADAVTACAGGFRWTVGAEQLDASKVTEGTAPKAGEEAVAFTAVTPVDGVNAPWKVVVFRDGATLAHFTVANVAAMTSGEDFTFPADLVTAQADKLA